MDKGASHALRAFLRGYASRKGIRGCSVFVFRGTAREKATPGYTAHPRRDARIDLA
ncbi:MAG: hypothetical protein ABWK01_07710 [Infirmifilum sp.]